MQHQSLLLVTLLAVFAIALPTPLRADESRPNFVVFLVDDLGYMDISPNNPDTFYETPNLERLAQQGLRFTNGYAANPVCSPTRYSLMTGKYPTRVQATNFFAGKREGRFRPAPLNDRMPLSEITLAEALKQKGYRTAFLGKWHLGPTEEFWPEHQGFDINVGGFHRGSPPGGYFSPYKNPRLDNGPKGEHLTRRLTDEAIAILENLQDQPFLLYLSFYTVHTPLQAPADLVEKYRKKAAELTKREEFKQEEQVWPTEKERKVRVVQNHPTYAAMVETMDTSIGRVLDQLEQLGLADNTVICFTSDNGGLSTSEGSPTSNLPLRGGKGWLYEGGIREPFLMKWPGHTIPGSVSDTPICSIDLHPTLCEIAGIDDQQLPQRDGISLVSLMKQPEKEFERPLFWHYPHYSNQGGFPGGAVRQGDWKLIERFEDGRCHLYNLANDPGEQNDQAGQNPQRTAAMKEALHAWYDDVNARFLERKTPDQVVWRP